MKKRVLALLLILVVLLPSAVASAAYYRVNTTWLKVRRLPSSKAEVLDSYRKDWALTINKKYGDWSYVIFTNGKDGYVQTKYLKKSSSYKAWITTNNTSMRRGPDYSFNTVGTLAKGTKVTVLCHGASYDYISTSVGNGYVKNSFLSKKKVKPSGEESTAVDEPVSEGIEGYVVNPNGNPVNLRRGPGTEYPVISSYKVGTKLTVLTKGSVWCKVTISGATGYMMTQYINMDVTKTAPPPPAGDPTPTPGPKPPYTAYITSPDGKSVNIHRGAGLGYSNVCRLAVNTVVTVRAHTNAKWTEIRIGANRIGYVMSQYLTTVVPPYIIDPDEPTPTPYVTQFPYSATIWADNGLPVNIHNGPGLGYGNVCRLDVGTKVSVIAHKTEKWYKISFTLKEKQKDGTYAQVPHTGYVLKQYLKFK